VAGPISPVYSTPTNLSTTTMDRTQIPKKRKLSIDDLHAPPEATSSTAPTPTQTSSKHDVSINHGALDAQVERNFQLLRSLNQKPEWPALLSYITLADIRLESHTIDEAEGLLTRQPSIYVVLEKAWEEGSFEIVRQLGVFGVRYASSF
jgi:hypothetical protein